MKKRICLCLVLAVLAAGLSGCRMIMGGLDRFLPKFSLKDIVPTAPAPEQIPTTQPVTAPQSDTVTMYLETDILYDGQPDMHWEYKLTMPEENCIMRDEYWYENDQKNFSTKQTITPRTLLEELPMDDGSLMQRTTYYNEAGQKNKVIERLYADEDMLDYSDEVTQYRYNEDGIPCGQISYSAWTENETERKGEERYIDYDCRKTANGWTVTRGDSYTGIEREFYDKDGRVVKRELTDDEGTTTFTYTYGSAGQTLKIREQGGGEYVYCYNAVRVKREVAELYPMFHWE